MKQNNSIFTRVLALVLCMLMCAGVLTACFQMPEFNPVQVAPNGVTTPDSTTDDVVENTPNEDPTDPVDPEPVDPEPVDPNVIFSASTTVDSSNLILGSLTNDVVIGGEGATALVPADVMLETGTSSIALTLKNVEENDVDFGDAELLNNLDVHISGIAANNTVPMTVALGAILEAGLGATELKLYHIENGEAVLMTRVASASDFAIHNQYTYNEETGEVTIYVASFSTFSMVKVDVDVWNGVELEAADQFAYGSGTEEDPYLINSAAELVYFRNQVDSGVTFEGLYVKLNKDIDLAGHLFNPIGFGYTYNKDSNTAFMGTFDGGNHTIYGLYQNGWDLDPDKTNYSTYTYSTAGGGLFASIENATIKNLVMDGADIVFECVDIGIVVGYAQGNCHFENIVVTNSKIANYNRATGAVVGEVCYGSYVTDVEAGYSHTFKNIVVDSSVVVSSLWGSFDTLIGGVIGGKWGDATVKMENVITAAELDVYSDVTAAYQWYAYRRCGMLIGHTEQNSPKSALNAAAPFLTCENVEVYYGDWVKYNYYEFANQESSTGRRYPWVRAEESPVGNNGAFSNPRYGVPTHNGVKVTEDPNMETLKTNYTPIVFNQLYGGGQGVYGCAEHDGVTTNSKTFKTIYVHNDAGWTNLKLQYWFANGDDTWSTIIDGIDMTSMFLEGNTYKIQLPDGAYAFKIVADGQESDTFVLADLANNATVTLKGEVVEDCTHTNTTTTTVDATCTVVGSTTVVCDDCNETISVTEIPATGVHTWGTTSPYACTNNCGETAETKIIYFENTKEWTTLNFNGGTWSNSVALSTLPHTTNGTNEVYTFEIPAHVIEITVSGGTASATPAMTVKNLVGGNVYALTSDGKTINSTVYKAGVKTVKFVDEWTWTKNSFKVYYWYSDGENDWYTADWEHRTAMTLEGTNTYTFDIPAYADGYVISGVYETHTLQTLDQDIDDLETVTYHPIDCVIIDSQKHDGMMTIFYQNDWWYTNVYLHHWNIATDKGTTWPGDKMTKVGWNGTYDIYALTIEEGKGFIINDGGSRQSDDIISGAYDGKMYTGGKSNNKVYLKPNSNWTQSNARFAVYFFNNSTNKNEWVSMTYNQMGGVYECEIKSGYPNLIFCRMSTSTANNWNNKWNQTGDLNIPTGNNNVFTVPSGAWDGSTSGWSDR